MICKSPCKYAIICPDCQATKHPKKGKHDVDNIQDFLDTMAEGPEDKRARLLAMKAAIEGQMAIVQKEKHQIEQLVGNGQVEVSKEAATVLDGYKKTSDFARQKITASINGLQQQHSLCDYYLGVIAALGDKAKLSSQFTPDQCRDMIQKWDEIEKNLAKPGEAVAQSMTELIVKKNEFMQVHYEILTKLKSLEAAWLQYALSDEKSLIEFATNLFHQVDADHGGQLEYHELQNFIIAFFTSLGTAPPPISEIHNMFQKYDTDKSGRLSFDESMALAKDILGILLAKAKTPSAAPPPSA